MQKENVPHGPGSDRSENTESHCRQSKGDEAYCQTENRRESKYSFEYKLISNQIDIDEEIQEFVNSCFWEFLQTGRIKNRREDRNTFELIWNGIQ